MSAARRASLRLPPRRRIADVEPADRFAVPTDYVAAVYGVEAAERYVEHLSASPEQRDSLLLRAKKLGKAALVVR